MGPDAERRRDIGAKARIFISYSRKDMAFVDRLEPALKARGFEPLIDRADIYAFENWWKRIQALIGQADTIVFVLSPDAVKSEVALKEVAYAASLNKRFAPIVWQRAEDAAVPGPLRELNFIFFDDPAEFDVKADALAEGLRTDIGWIRRHTEFGEAARHWDDSGRPSGLLLRPPMLDRAEAWIALRPDDAPLPTAGTETFIFESRKAEVAAKRRNRILNAALYTALLGIIIGLIGWINQDYIYAQWKLLAVTRPFMEGKVKPYVLALAAERALKPKDTFRECAVAQDADLCPVMVVVTAGSFMMGSPPGEAGHEANEAPQHAVTIAKTFAVAKFQLTFDEWDTCVDYGDCPRGASDAGWGRGQRPAIGVSWDDGQRYVTWLSKMTGKSYRLLSEAEYEYAERAGTKTAFFWGDEVGEGNANCNSCGTPFDNHDDAPVGSFAANTFGLYDMEGNVWEWVEDCYHPDYDGAPTDGSAWSADCPDDRSRVERGGGKNSPPRMIRSAARLGAATDARRASLGFRVARTLSQ
jgi:formylglycine-generating enzyme required for sulfatase activity